MSGPSADAADLSGTVGGETDTPPTAIPVGDIEFLDNFVPAVDPGRYTLTATQTVVGGTPDQGLDPQHQQPPVPKTEFAVTQAFQVQGSRFLLDPSEIHAVFPPQGTNGKYEQRLAQVVLNKRALPWEHPLASTTQHPVAKSVPWLALLVLTDDQLVTTHFPPPQYPQQPNPTRAGTLPLAEVLGTPASPDPEVTIVGPCLELSPWEHPTTTVQAIDLMPDTFRHYVPTLEVAPLLTHVRKVHVGDKPELGLKDSGWFSLVVNDRLPMFVPRTSHDTAPTRYVAHLVSIEGFEQYLRPDPEALPAGNVVVRMISLASWTFGVEPEGASFAALTEHLLTAASEQGTGWRLRLPQTPARRAAIDSEDPTEAFAARALAAGYAPMAYQSRVGDHTFGWYRGPLAPVPVAPYLAANPPRTAAEATVYDAGHGVFDLSYGVAFQTGRLVALSSSSFSVALLNWRRQLHKTVDTVIERARSQHLAAFTGDGRAAADRSTEELRGLLEPATPVQDHFAAVLTREFATGVAGQLTRPGGIGDVARSTRPRRARALIGEVRSAMASPAVRDLLQSDPDLVPADIVNWLAQLVLLDGVPFNNLVCDAAMLPEESIRFFSVDPNWLIALVDGALSVGAQTFRDTVATQAMREPLLRAVGSRTLTLRQRPTPAPAPASGAQPSPEPIPPMTGLLLRSAAVSGYRSLQVRAFSDTNNGTPIPVLRLAELSPSVLLALFQGTPALVAIDEPREGLGFGVEDNSDPNGLPVVEMRYVNGDQVGNPYSSGGHPATVEVSFLGQTHRLDIVDIATKIKATVAPDQDHFGPADLALNMVHVPEQMLWNPPTGGTHD